MTYIDSTTDRLTANKLGTTQTSRIVTSVRSTYILYTPVTYCFCYSTFSIYYNSTLKSVCNDAITHNTYENCIVQDLTRECMFVTYETYAPTLHCYGILLDKMFFGVVRKSYGVRSKYSLSVSWYFCTARCGHRSNKSNTSIAVAPIHLTRVSILFAVEDTCHVVLEHTYE